jgi:3-oxoacyl-[acyl-carrier-protein] synthase I
MNVPQIAVLRSGLITSVGLSAAQSCAAFRAKLTNPIETRFLDPEGEWIVAHQVPLDQPWRGVTRLVKMAAIAIAEAVEGIDKDELTRIPLLLCVAEKEREGNMVGSDDQLMVRIETELGVHFAAESTTLAEGRVGVAVALAEARARIAELGLTRVLVAATDSLLSRATLKHYGGKGRLLTAANSNGFIPGEAAAALLVGPATGSPREVACTGIGFGHESAHVESDEPLRGDGLSQAIKAALGEAGRRMSEMDFRITDIAGEHYYFKEATLAASRILRDRRHDFDIWHPAECTGEVGSAAGVGIVVFAKEACDKGYAIGPNILAHMANDDGRRAALCFKHYQRT